MLKWTLQPRQHQPTFAPAVAVRAHGDAPGYSGPAAGSGLAVDGQGYAVEKKGRPDEVSSSLLAGPS